MVSKAKLQVKICDFGLATLHQNKRTLLHSYCGSPSYGKMQKECLLVCSSFYKSRSRNNKFTW